MWVFELANSKLQWHTIKQFTEFNLRKENIVAESYRSDELQFFLSPILQFVNSVYNTSRTEISTKIPDIPEIYICLISKRITQI